MRRNEVILLYGIGYKDLVHAIFYNKRKRVSAFIIDETVIQIGDHHYWLWICIEPIHKSVLGINISQKKETCL
jgi:transposase-like protein